MAARDSLLGGVLAALERVQGPDARGWYTALCPFHNDRQRPNLRFTDKGFQCMACDRKGSLRALGERLGLENGAEPRQDRFVEAYDYRDETGQLLFQVVRLRNPKDFRQRRPDGAGGWIWKLGNTRRVLYRLPDLLAADPTQPVFIVEGEKDADQLWSEGLVATTNPGGVGKWRDEYADALRGRHAIVLQDNDPPGRDHAGQVARSAHSVAAEVRVLELPGLPQHGDVSDWLDAGGTVEQLRQLAATAPIWTPTNETKPEHFAATDAGNGELFARLYGDRVRYDHRRRRWLIWAGHWWQDDLDGEVRRLAKIATRHRYLKASAIDDLHERTAAAKFAIISENRQRLDAMLLQAQTEPPIADAGDQWDADSWLFAAANGVVDLRGGVSRDGLPQDRITLHSPAAFDTNAECPRWLRFLNEVFRGDEDLIDFIWRAVGYSLTGDTREQCLFLCYGTGSNGKSVFLSILRAIAGGYAYNSPFSTFELDKRAAIPNDVAALAGRRLVTSSETNEGTRLNEARLKALTGGDPATARFLHGEFFTFVPVAKFWLAVNHRPVVTDDSYGFWRRVRLIPFVRVFKGDEDDQLLTEALKEELPGILAWAARGSLEWQSRGLAPPDAVKVATESYRVESDPLAQFIDERCVVAEGAQVGAAAAYKAYTDWATSQGISERERLTNTKFGTRMSGRFEKTKTRSGKVYIGIGLLDQTGRAEPVTGGGGVTGWVTGCESEDRKSDVFPPTPSLSRKNLQEPVTTRHPVTDADRCASCQELVWQFGADGTPYCRMHVPEETPT